MYNYLTLFFLSACALASGSFLRRGLSNVDNRIVGGQPAPARYWCWGRPSTLWLGNYYCSFLRRGLSNVDNRIVGGQPAPAGSVPYQASLRMFGSHFCGGSILNKRWILTAAHCTEGSYPAFMKVVVGTNSLVNGGDSYSISKIIIHESYNEFLIQNDVSLVKVSSDIVFNDDVKPVNLPANDTGAGAALLLSGWGTTTYPGSVPNDLQWINLTALGVADCRSRFDGINDVFDSQICSLTKSGEGACHGDSGGPLVEGDSVVGIVSWGMPCARGYPDVYTRVHSFKDWILNKIAQN